MGHDNNFQALRYIAAALVIVTHGHALRGTPDVVDIAKRLTGFSFGWIGVNMFFAISGYLITQSMLRTQSVARFFAARVLRIYPSLIVCVIVTVALCALISTYSIADYFADPRTAHFVISNSTLVTIKYELPGVFQENPHPGAVNGSLWTLQYEVGCYAMVAALFAVGALSPDRRRPCLYFLILLAACTQIVLPDDSYFRLEHMSRLGLCFALGMAVGAGVFQVRGAPLIGLLAAWLAISPTPLSGVTLCFGLSLATLWVARAPFRLLRTFNRLPDYSYGVYIYAFPIQQGLILFRPELSPLENAIGTLGLVLIPASLSWHLIEKPSLSLKNRGSAASIPL